MIVAKMMAYGIGIGFIHNRHESRLRGAERTYLRVVPPGNTIKWLKGPHGVAVMHVYGAMHCNERAIFFLEGYVIR